MRFVEWGSRRHPQGAALFLALFPVWVVDEAIRYTGVMDRPLSVTITPGTIVTTLLILAGGWLLYELFDLVLVLLTAIVIASGIEPAARWFIRYKVPRVLSILIVYLLFVGSVIGMLYVVLPIFLVQAAAFVAALPTYFDFLNHLPGQYSPILTSVGLDPMTSVSDLVTKMQHIINDFTGDSFATVSTVFGGVFSSLLILVFSFYFAVEERGIEDLLRIITPRRHEAYAIGLWRRSQKKIALWLQGQLLLGVIVGVLVFLMLSILNIPHALVLAVLAGFFELIPVFGPTLSAIPAVMVGFVSGGPVTGLIVVALYVIIQQFENHLIYPLVVTKVVGVPPLLVILGLIIGGKVAGFLGILLSAPLAAVIQEVVQDFDQRKPQRVDAGGDTGGV